MRRLPALAVCLAALLGGVCGWSRAAGGESGEPDILWITVDTLRADHLSCYGNPKPLTPVLDGLLSRGVRFAQARTPEPLTHPAMTSMLTSLYPHQHGGARNGLRMRVGLDSAPRILRERGYATAAFVSNWTLKPKVTGLDAHFDTYRTVLTKRRWFGLVRSEAHAAEVVDQALAWLDELDGEAPGRPVLLWVHFSDPHAPYEFWSREGERLGLTGKTKAERYATEVAYTDRAIGDLLTGFARRRAPRRPLVLFAADHGESLGEHGYWGHGRHLFDEELRVPMGIVWEGVLAPRVVEAPASLIDLAPTALALVGVGAPAAFAGYDWSGVLNGAPPPEGRATRHQAHKGAVMIRHKSSRARRSGLIAVAMVGNGIKEILEPSGKRTVYDLVSDPSELRPRAGEGSPAGARISAWLSAVQAGLLARNPEDGKLDPESLEKLRSLGYVD